MDKNIEFVNVPIKKELLEQIQALSVSTKEIYESQEVEDFVNNILVTEKMRLQKLQNKDCEELIKISRVEAFQALDEIDMKVYSYETDMLNNMAANSKTSISGNFYLTADEENIFYIITNDDTGEEIYRLAFKNK